MIDYTVVADCLENYADGGDETSAKYIADARRLRIGQQPVHVETYEALLDSEGPMLYADNQDVLLAYMQAVITIVTPQRLWVNEERTVLARQWPNGRVEVALRDESWETWGPPIRLEEEK